MLRNFFVPGSCLLVFQFVCGDVWINSVWRCCFFFLLEIVESCLKILFFWSAWVLSAIEVYSFYCEEFWRRKGWGYALDQRIAFSSPIINSEENFVVCSTVTQEDWKLVFVTYIEWKKKGIRLKQDEQTVNCYVDCRLVWENDEFSQFVVLFPLWCLSRKAKSRIDDRFFSSIVIYRVCQRYNFCMFGSARISRGY